MDGWYSPTQKEQDITLGLLGKDMTHSILLLNIILLHKDKPLKETSTGTQLGLQPTPKPGKSK